MEINFKPTSDFFIFIGLSVFSACRFSNSQFTSFSRQCLKLIPHKKFSYAKVWLLAAQFEIRQLNLKGARRILGNAIGIAPKDKVMCKLILILLIDLI